MNLASVLKISVLVSSYLTLLTMPVKAETITEITQKQDTVTESVNQSSISRQDNADVVNTNTVTCTQVGGGFNQLIAFQIYNNSPIEQWDVSTRGKYWDLYNVVVRAYRGCS